MRAETTEGAVDVTVTVVRGKRVYTLSGVGPRRVVIPEGLVGTVERALAAARRMSEDAALSSAFSVVGQPEFAETVRAAMGAASGGVDYRVWRRSRLK